MTKDPAWIENATKKFWDVKIGRLQVLMGNAIDRFVRRDPDVSHFSLTSDEFKQVWSKMAGEAEDFAAEEALLGHITRSEMAVLRDVLVAAIGKRLPEIKDRSLAEIGPAKDEENAPPRRRGRPPTRSL